MKKVIFLLGLLTMAIIVASCETQTPDKPYIKNINPEKSFGIAGDKINVAISIENPIAIDYNGNVLIQADSPDCFGMGTHTVGTSNNVRGYISQISVEAGKINTGLITMNIPQNNQLVCYEPSNHKLTVFLLQSDKVLDSKTLDFALFKQG